MVSSEAELLTANQKSEISGDGATGGADPSQLEAGGSTLDYAEFHDTVPNVSGIGPKSGRKTFANRTNPVYLPAKNVVTSLVRCRE